MYIVTPALLQACSACQPSPWRRTAIRVGSLAGTGDHQVGAGPDRRHDVLVPLVGELRAPEKRAGRSVEPDEGRFGQRHHLAIGPRSSIGDGRGISRAHAVPRPDLVGRLPDPGRARVPPRHRSRSARRACHRPRAARQRCHRTDPSRAPTPSSRSATTGTPDPASQLDRIPPAPQGEDAAAVDRRRRERTLQFSRGNGVLDVSVPGTPVATSSRTVRQIEARSRSRRRRAGCGGRPARRPPPGRSNRPQWGPARRGQMPRAKPPAPARRACIAVAARSAPAGPVLGPHQRANRQHQPR